MENSEPKQAASEAPVRKRSSKERAIVWFGIVLLIGVVYLEWQSRDQYETSYKNLETAINSRDEKGRLHGVPVGDVQKYVKGFAFHSDKIVEDKTTPIRGEPIITKRRRVTYQWPSLFKRYEFRLNIDNDEKAIQIEPVIPGINK